MAKTQINTKSKDYLRNKEVFLKELKSFNESKSIPYKIPNINGIDIDLYLLYTLVQQRGGINKVNQTDVWDTFLRPLRLPHPCINGSTLLRRIYSTYLEKYDKAKGPPGRDDDNDMDDDPRGRTRNVPRFSLGGAYISASGETLRTGTPRAIAGPSERLALSLLSPMPNEQDFAINVCTVLAADFANRLPLSSTPHILDFLLAHAGVYNHASLRDTIGRSYYEVRGRYPHEFWQLRAGGGGANELADEGKFTAPGLEQPELVVQAMAAHNNLTDRLMQGDDDDVMMEKVVEEDVLDDWVAEPSEEDQLFAPELPGGSKCVFTQRVLQIASIIRSLSFHEENVQYLSRNTTLLRFLLLCSNCWVGTLRQSGLDTLGNVCTELVIKEPATCLISRHVLSTIQTALGSADRARILAALEMLNKLAQNEANEDVLIRALEAKVYSDVCSLLTLRDIMVLVCTLECVYALTSLGERASECVAKVSGLIHTLVSLVTVEAQSYGPKACILMRVVETVSGPAPLPTDAPVTSTATPSADVTQLTATPAVSKGAPSPAVSAPAPPAPVSVAPTNLLQQQHTQQKTIQENEQFALAWLRTSYEALPANDNSGLDAGEVYRSYLACCTKLGRKGVIAPSHFPRLVRTTFGGTVGPNTVSLSTGETSQMYVGVRSKPHSRAPPPASPILKATLTNKNDTKGQPQQSTSHPTLSQALEGSSSNTTLIKHLLAHKVSPAPNTVQVAQRQQNQQKAALPVNTVIQQQIQNPMEVDPEALIKCTTIIPGGVSGTGSTESKVIVTPGEEPTVPKEEFFQTEESSQQKPAQNKMLADLLEKKSNPPVQVVQMTPQSINAPTIQITETGQIVQVKADPTPVIQLNTESTPLLTQSPFYQVKNEQGQVIQLKNDQGQIIQLKAEQLAGLSGQILLKTDQFRVKTETDQIVESVNSDHAYIEPPSKKIKVESKREKSPQESVSKTAANLYAALAASALEDEEDLMPVKQEQPMEVISPVIVGPDASNVIIQEPLMQVQQPTLQVQQPTMQVQNALQVQQQIQVQQPMLQVQPMDVQNIIATQGGQLILQQDKQMSQQTHLVQQPMQIIAAPTSTQGGISYITQGIPSSMVQKTIIIVQGSATGGPITLTVNNPAGLDDATINQVLAQATEAITQQQIIQNSGVIQSAQRVIVSQPTLHPAAQTITMVKTTQNPPQLAPSQQPIITPQPQAHKAQLVMAQKTPTLIATTSANQIIQGGQQLMQGSQQIIAVSNNQQIIMNAPMKTTGHRVINQSQRVINQSDNKATVIQSTGVNCGVVRQVITRQPVMVAGTKIGDKETIVTQHNNDVQPIKPKTPTPKPTATPPPHANPQDDTPWICHWKGCGKSFDCASSVFSHCARAHCPGVAGLEAPCLWVDCDRVPRRTFALLNHINDRHCTAEALKAVYNSRRHIAAEAESNKPVSIGYPPNAAMAALNKNAVEFLNPRELMQRADINRNNEQTDENEGPVTKSIRLTAALILRNLVIYSNTGRRHLRSYEAHLATIALSNVEASRTIAQVLYDMNNI